MVRKELKIEGMTCTSCENRIEKVLSKTEGIISVNANFTDSIVKVEFNEEIINIKEIEKIIENLDYKVVTKTNKNINQVLGIVFILFAVYFLIDRTVSFNFIPKIDQSMGYGILFVVGLLTSIHCIAMCGGINISLCMGKNDEENKEKLKPALLYNIGRVISYTVIGGLIGLVGKALSFSGTTKGIIQILTGLFMMIMGLNMLNVFKSLRKINIKMPKFITSRINKSKKNQGPFVVGLLNGFMPCGPLQSMQLYALGTGSFLAGALSMFFFSLGTVPLMLGLGLISTFLSGKFTSKMLKVSAFLVMFLGIVMIDRGFNLSGFSIASLHNKANNSVSGTTSNVKGDFQEITSTFENGRYTPITVKKGIPVRWTIKIKDGDLNGCNNPLTIPKYKITKKLIVGDNLIDEFTPTEIGTIRYTCWMGMVSSTINVVDDVKDSTQKTEPEQINSQNISSGSCCADGAKATKFLGGNIPLDNIQLAKITKDTQSVTIKVNDEGYSPAVIVLQKGIKAKIKFNPEKLNTCNYLVQFPDYRAQLDLKNGQIETPFITPEKDFTFNCNMGMLNGYVKVVDDLNKVNLDEIKATITKALKNKPVSSGGCC